MDNYQEVPNIISGKDLDYLSDMFNWNYGAFKQSLNAYENAEDSEVKSILEKASNIFRGNISNTLDIIKGGSSNE